MFYSVKISKTVREDLDQPLQSRVNLINTQQIKWIAMSPINSPLYALAHRVCLRNEPTSLPRPLEHSNINADKQMLGFHSLIYKPSVTAIHELSVISFSIHFLSPTKHKESHIHLHPHSINTSIDPVGGLGWVTVRYCKHRRSYIPYSAESSYVRLWLIYP